jgi:hypothetical protein
LLAGAVALAALVPALAVAPASASVLLGAGSAPRAAGSAPSGSAPAGAAAHVSGAVVPAAATVPKARAKTRLTLSVGTGPRLTVTAGLTRAANGVRIPGRLVEVWTRTADTGTWGREQRIRTSSRGVAVVQLPDRPSLQITLRFRGDAAFGPAASVTLVPDPTGARGLDPRLVTALGKARAAAHRAGLSLVLNSGFRTWAKQRQMYLAAVRQYGSAVVARRWVLPPQESTHVRGLAVDVGPPATARWLNAHGAAFGLCRAYGDEPWHFEYRPDWIAAFHGRCPAPVPLPGDPDALSPQPHVAVVF